MASDTKYSIDRRSRWSLRGDRPRLSDHIVGGGVEGIGRWDQRTPDGSCSPERAFERGVDLRDDVLDWFTADGRRPDRVRLTAEDLDGGRYVACFVIHDGVAATVIRAKQFDRPAVRSYLHARAEEVLADGD